MNINRISELFFFLNFLIILAHRGHIESTQETRRTQTTKFQASSIVWFQSNTAKKVKYYKFHLHPSISIIFYDHIRRTIMMIFFLENIHVTFQVTKSKNFAIKSQI